MRDFHIKLKSEAQTVYTFFLVSAYGVRHILIFPAMTDKKQVTMDYLCGEGPGRAMNCILYLSVFLECPNIAYVLLFIKKNVTGGSNTVG